MGSFSAVVAATSSKSGSSSYTFLLLIVLVFVGFYFLMIRPQRRRQQQAQQQQRTLSPGARVRTTAGMYATVSAVDGDDVILEVAGKSVANPGDVSEAVKTAHADNKNNVLMRVRSGNTSHYVAVPLGNG